MRNNIAISLFLQTLEMLFRLETNGTFPNQQF